MASDTQNTATTFRRKYPRRQFGQPMGVLIQGKFLLVRSTELGEGGMAFDYKGDLEEGARVVVSFSLPSGQFICTKAMVRSQLGARVGVQFDDLPFQLRRIIRAFVTIFTN